MYTYDKIQQGIYFILSMKKSIPLTFLFMMLAYAGYCQQAINITIYVDDTLQAAIAKETVVKFRFKGERDTLVIYGNNGQIKLPALEKELDYFEVRYGWEYSCYMDFYAAEVEGKSIFLRSGNAIQIRIDNYPFSNLTKSRFPAIKKNQYSMIFGQANDSPDSGHFGFFNAIGNKE